jgi:hypothetical protein
MISHQGLNFTETRFVIPDPFPNQGHMPFLLLANTGLRSGYSKSAETVLRKLGGICHDVTFYSGLAFFFKRNACRHKHLVPVKIRYR